MIFFLIDKNILAPPSPYGTNIKMSVHHHQHHHHHFVNNLQGVLVAGFGSGHLRLFSLPSGRLLAEIAAHNGWITGLDEGCCSNCTYVHFPKVYCLKIVFGKCVGELIVSKLLWCKAIVSSELVHIILMFFSAHSYFDI